MTRESVERLAQEVYGPEVNVLSQALNPELVQVAVVHSKGIPLVLVTAKTEESGAVALVAALNALKAG